MSIILAIHPFFKRKRNILMRASVEVARSDRSGLGDLKADEMFSGSKGWWRTMVLAPDRGACVSTLGSIT